MSVVGGFPGINAARRRTVRAAVNPMDKSTIFSIYPKTIIERHHTVQPGLFEVPAGTYEKPSLLVVGSSSWWREIDEEQPLLEIPNGSVQVADAVVKGYCSGLFACNMATNMPGLFWLPGEYKRIDCKEDKKVIDALKAAKVRQDSWYRELVKLTDGLWARTNGNPLVVSDDARMAARELNLTGKDWMKDFVMSTKTSCPACGSPRNPEYPVCPSCKYVDQVKARELGMVFAIDTSPLSVQSSEPPSGKSAK